MYWQKAYRWGFNAPFRLRACGNPKAPQIACDYFVWKDPSGLTRDGKENKESKRNLSEMYNENNYEGARAGSADLPPHPLCQCGLPTTRLTCRQGKNEGKVFYVCLKDKGSQCKYWEWETNVLAGRTREFKRTKGDGINTASDGPTGRSGIGGRAVGSACFKCKQEGHWASNCPNY